MRFDARTSKRSLVINDVRPESRLIAFSKVFIREKWPRRLGVRAHENRYGAFLHLGYYPL